MNKNSKSSGNPECPECAARVDLADALSSALHRATTAEAESKRLSEIIMHHGGQKDCPQCHGAGEVQDSTEGGIWILCACVRAMLDAQKEKVKKAEAERDVLKARLERCEKALAITDEEVGTAIVSSRRIDPAAISQAEATLMSLATFGATVIIADLRRRAGESGGAGEGKAP